jgi:hypothetical protein
MPTFEFTDPGGKSYSVDGPEGATPEQAFQILQQHLAPKSEGSSLGGVAKSLGTGLAQGVIGLAGLPADIAHLYAPNQSDANPLGSEGLQKKVEQYTGDFYKPQGTAEDIASKIGQFAPAMIGGPETLATKALTRVVAPAVASEAGGAVGGPIGEVAGALAGGAGASAAAQKFKAMAAARALPDLTSQEIKTASRAGYQHPDVAAVKINPGAVDNLATTIESDLVGQGYRPNNQSSVFQTVNELKGAPGPVGVADLDAARKALGILAKEKDAIGQMTPQAAAASQAMGHIDRFLPNLSQADLLAGDATKANSILSDARGNWASYKKSSQVQNLLSNAELNAASANSGGNIQNSIKQAFKPLLKNGEAKVSSWSDEERAALNKIVRGTWTGSAARAAGNLLGGGGGLGMLASGAVGYHEGGVGGAIGAGLAGRALKKIGNASTFNAVKKLDTLIRSGSPEALKMAAQNPQVAAALPPKSVLALRALIAADPALRAAQQQSQPVSQTGTY